MAKPTVVRGEHEHAVRLQGNDPVAQSKSTKSKSKDLSAETPVNAGSKGPAVADSKVKVVLPKPRPTPKAATPKPSVKPATAPVAAPVTTLAAGSVLTPEEVWETESHIVQRLSALKFKNSQLTAQIQRLADTLPGKGNES